MCLYVLVAWERECATCLNTCLLYSHIGKEMLLVSACLLYSHIGKEMLLISACLLYSHIGKQMLHVCYTHILVKRCCL